MPGLRPTITQEEKQAQPLTPAQEAFCQQVVLGKDYAEAYAYVKPGQHRYTVARNSKAWAEDPRIQARIAAIRRPVISRVRYELADAMRESAEACEFAKQQGSATALVQALTLRAKLNGLLTEDRKNDRRPLSDLTDDDLRRFIADAAAVIGMQVGIPTDAGLVLLPPEEPELELRVLN